jgi:hypothetical protein
MLMRRSLSAGSRGSGVAAALIDDAEARLLATGVETARLGCAIGNERAARFYEKRGWHRVGTMISRLDTSFGEYLLEVRRYEKKLTSSRRNPSTEATAASPRADSPSAGERVWIDLPIAPDAPRRMSPVVLTRQAAGS